MLNQLSQVQKFPMAETRLCAVVNNVLSMVIDMPKGSNRISEWSIFQNKLKLNKVTEQTIRANRQNFEGDFSNRITF